MAQAPISAIPPEILSIIFEYVHSDYLITHDLVAKSRDESDDDSDDDSDTSFERAQNLVNVEKLLELATKPTFFPYALASVSPFWEEVLSSTPEFWTCLVFFLDPDFTESKKVDKYLSWSRDLPIDVLMTRRPDPLLRPPPWVAEFLETPLVLGNMQSLMPHFHRCRTLHVDVAINISLPVLPSRLRCETPLLQTISFASDLGMTVWDKDDQKHVFFAESIADGSEGGSAFTFRPKLKCLNIDGRNFQRAFAEAKPWITEQDELEDLTIFQYMPVAMSRKTSASEVEFDTHTCKECRLDLYLALGKIESFGSLTTLKFDMVHFEISPSDPSIQEEMFDLSRLHNLTLEDMAPDVIQEILRVCLFEDMEGELASLTFIHCPRLHEALIPALGVPNLFLLGLKDDVDLEPIVTSWFGDFLSISCCFSFTDAFLEFLGTADDAASDSEDEDDVDSESTFPCNEMAALDIHFAESPPFSVNAMRKMIEARNCDVDYSDKQWKDNTVWGPAIMSLRVRGSVPELSLQDEEWFRSRMLRFSWGASDEELGEIGPFP